MPELIDLEQELEKALKEIGTIKPWKDDDVGAFVFEHPAYPVRCAGKTKKEVIENFSLYLRDFIEERLQGNLAPFVEQITTGRGGKRDGAGRPAGTTKEPTKMVRLPVVVADWIKANDDNLEKVRKLMAD